MSTINSYQYQSRSFPPWGIKRCFKSCIFAKCSYKIFFSYPFHLTSFLRPDDLKKKLTVWTRVTENCQITSRGKFQSKKSPFFIIIFIRRCNYNLLHYDRTQPNPSDISKFLNVQSDYMDHSFITQDSLYKNFLIHFEWFMMTDWRTIFQFL